jgi:hypothetical protein
LAVIVTAVIGAAAGFAVAVDRGIRVTDSGVQGAVVGAIAGVGGGVVGSLIGAIGAWIVARQNREDGRRFRFADRTRQLAIQIEDAVRRQAVQVGVQLETRRLIVNLPEDRLPGIGDVDDLTRDVLELDLVATGREAPVAAHLLVLRAGWLVRRYQVHYPQDFQDGLILPVSPDLTKSWPGDLESLNPLIIAFADAVRRDLGLKPIHTTAATVSPGDSATPVT